MQTGCGPDLPLPSLADRERRKTAKALRSRGTRRCWLVELSSRKLTTSREWPSAPNRDRFWCVRPRTVEGLTENGTAGMDDTTRIILKYLIFPAGSIGFSLWVKFVWKGRVNLLDTPLGLDIHRTAIFQHGFADD